MNKRKIGDVRPSQLITTFGPGAIVDLQSLSVIVSGIDIWPIAETKVFHEERLERALEVARFVAAKTTEENSDPGTIPSFIFPRYQVCPKCNTLSEIGDNHVEFDKRRNEVKCKAPNCPGKGSYRATTIPAPLIVSCPSGHIDDFPWREYVHRGKTECKKRMEFYSLGKTGSIADLIIECTCGTDEKKVRRSLLDAFAEGSSAVLGPCSKRRPWLGSKDYDTICKHSNNVRAMQRGATNVWFPVVRSTLYVKESASPIGMALKECDSKQIQNIDSEETLHFMMSKNMFPSLNKFVVNDIYTSILKQRGELQYDEIDLRLPEWEALRNPKMYSKQSGELFLEESKPPAEYQSLISRVILARKLSEIRALVGFTRIESSSTLPEADIATDVAPIYKTRPDWLPAVEVRGEGIFIELNEAVVSDWEQRTAVKKRAAVMSKKFKEWAQKRGQKNIVFPGARYLLLHSLAHTLIRQLSLDCGYSASSIRERIYSSHDPNYPMAGILLYTASPDSEGSLGGLVDLGSPNRFPNLLKNSLKSIVSCSSDPLCADHHPDNHASINAAACHACILISETSCESFNRFLDRNVLVPTIAHQDIAFFPDPNE